MSDGQKDLTLFGVHTTLNKPLVSSQIDHSYFYVVAKDIVAAEAMVNSYLDKYYKWSSDYRAIRLDILAKVHGPTRLKLLVPED